MSRRLRWIVAAILIVESVAAYWEYPNAKPLMRSGYVWLFHTANAITGAEIEPPDRFK